MGNTKNPDKVKPKDFSDSLELFDILFQEELENGTKTEGPPKSPAAERQTTPTKIPAEQHKEISDVSRKGKPGVPTSSPSAKPKTASRKTPPPQKEPFPAGRRSAPKSKGPAYDTLQMRRKKVRPTPEPEQTDEKPILKTEVVPQGIIVKGIKKIKEPPADGLNTEKVGKLFTPKVSKSFIPNVSIKESNLYKVVLSGFALAIIVMVVINFFGIIGSDESENASKPIKEAAVQNASLNKRPAKVAKKPKDAKILKAPRKIANNSAAVQRNSSKPASSPQVNNIAGKSQLKQLPIPKTPSVPLSTPPLETTPPKIAMEEPGGREQTLAPEPPPQVNQIARIPASPKASSQQKPASPVSSPEANATVIETALKEPDVRKSPPEPMVMTQPETKAPSKSPQSSPGLQKTVDKPLGIPQEKSYPYSVYLGAYKTPERAKVAVSQYQEQGFSSHWVKVDLGRKGTWFRLFTGYFRDEETAQDFIDKWDLEEANVKKTRYSTFIGLYSSKDDIKSKSLALLKLGYSTYVVDGVNGTSQLYSGAFITKAGAEKQYKELVAKGIRNRVVER